MSEIRESWLEDAPISGLKPHPRNYRSHPEDQLKHIMASIQKHGMYRNVVVAHDGTILAGHGVVEAARRLGEDTVPVHRLDVSPDDVRALEVLTGDNEVDHLGEVDDRALTELLKEINTHDVDGLLGTGYDEAMLANLAMITRPASELKDFNAAAEWVGMPEYEPEPDTFRVVVNCETEEDRDAFLGQLGVTWISKKTHGTYSIWYPLRQRESVTPLRFEDEPGVDGVEDPS